MFVLLEDKVLRRDDDDEFNQASVLTPGTARRGEDSARVPAGLKGPGEKIPHPSATRVVSIPTDTLAYVVTRRRGG